MSELPLHKLPKASFDFLQRLAAENDVSIVEQAMQVLNNALSPSTTNEDPLEISTPQLQENMDLLIAAYDRQPIFVRDDDHGQFVIMPIEEFKKLASD